MNKGIITLMSYLGFPREEIPVCIETGTFQGESTETFAQYFKYVHTIELSELLYQQNLKNYKLENVAFHQGTSVDRLQVILPSITDKYFIFLDAHASGGNTIFEPSIGRYGSPVLDEIEQLKINPPECVVIDDLNDFIKIRSYPEPKEIVAKIKELGNYKESILNLYNGWYIFQKIHNDL